jgi:hypothetical protein
MPAPQLPGSDLLVPKAGPDRPFPRTRCPAYDVDASVAPLIITEALFAASCNNLDDKWLYLIVTFGSECPSICWTSKSVRPLFTSKQGKGLGGRLVTKGKNGESSERYQSKYSLLISSEFILAITNSRLQNPMTVKAVTERETTRSNSSLNWNGCPIFIDDKAVIETDGAYCVAIYSM